MIEKLGQMGDFILNALFAWSGLDPSVAQLKAIPAMQEVNNKYREIAKQISDDDVLYNQLYNAFVDQNNQLAADIINSSPFGTRIRALRSQAANVTKEMDKLKKKMAANATKANTTSYDYQNEMLQAAGTGSALVDSAQKFLDDHPNLKSAKEAVEFWGNMARDARHKAHDAIDAVTSATPIKGE